MPEPVAPTAHTPVRRPVLADIGLGPAGMEARRARIGDSVRLTKAEAFEACQVLADADRCLVRAGRRSEASALAHLFELMEARLCDRLDGPSEGASYDCDACSDFSDSASGL